MNQAEATNNAAPEAEDKLNFKTVLPIFVIVLVDLLGLTIIIPVLPLYAVAFGADAFMVGLLSAAYPLMQLIGGPTLGGLSDRHGRRPVLIVSQIGTFAGFILLGLANALPLLFLSRIIDGFTGGNIVTAQAAISDVTTERNRAQGLGLIGAAFGLGFVMGPALAGIALAVTNNDYRVPAFLAAGCSLLSILLTTFWFKETLPEDQRGKVKARGHRFSRIREALNRPLVGALLMLMFFQQLVFGGFEMLLALFNLSRLGMDAAGNALVFVFVGIILVLVQGKFIGPWSRRFGERGLICAGLGLLAIGLTLTALTPEVPVPWYSASAFADETVATEGARIQVAVPLPDEENKGWLGLAWLLVAMVPAAIGGALLRPSINSLITKHTIRSEIGAMLGVSTSLVSLANASTPLIGGAIFQFMGTTAPFLGGGVIMAVLLLITLRMIRQEAGQDVAYNAAGD